MIKFFKKRNKGLTPLERTGLQKNHTGLLSFANKNSLTGFTTLERTGLQKNHTGLFSFANKNSLTGFTMIETATAIFILSVGICAILIIFPLSLKIIRSSDLATKAVGLAQKKIEDISSNDYDSAAIGTTSENLASPFNMFVRETTTDYVDPASGMAISSTETGIKKITVVIYWNSLLSIGQQNITVNGLISKH